MCFSIVLFRLLVVGKLCMFGFTSLYLCTCAFTMWLVVISEPSYLMYVVVVSKMSYVLVVYCSLVIDIADPVMFMSVYSVLSLLKVMLLRLR